MTIALWSCLSVIDEMAGGFLADALLLHQILGHIGDNGLFIIGINVLRVGRVLAVDEVERLGHSSLVFIIIDEALLIHLVEDRLLALFVCRGVIERIVLGRLVGDADDRCAFGQTQFGNVFAEIGLRRGLNAPTALAEVNSVEIPFDDLAFVVFLFQLKRAEDLGQLALNGDLVLARQVLDQLLRDRRTAIGIGHTGEHLDKSAGRTVPVNALVLVKALVLDRDESLFHIPGDLVVINPDAFFRAGERNKLLPAAGRVGIPDRTGLAELIVLERDVKRGGQAAFDVIGKDTAEDQPGKNKDQQHRADELENAAERDGNSVDRKVGSLGGNLTRVDPFELAAQRFETGAAFFLILFHLYENTSRGTTGIKDHNTPSYSEKELYHSLSKKGSDFMNFS